ncbi:hypothetical protein ACJ73_07945, partial [Blastomyces percursus]
MRVADFLNPSTPERSRTPEPAVPPDTTAEPSTAESQDRPVLGEISVRRAKITHRQVQYACQQEHPTPKKRPGRPVKLTEEQVNEIIEFITASRENRRA